MELAHDRTGAGPALVLIHGITENRSTWAPLIDALSEDFDVLAVDLRGHGASPGGDTGDPMEMAADVRDTVVTAGMMVDADDWPGPIMVGHSLGGVVATFYTAAFPTRGVINVDQSLQLAGFKDGLMQLEPMLRGDDASFQQAVQMIFASLGGALPPDEVARVQSIRRPDQDVVLGIWSSVLESSTEELASRIEQLLSGVTRPYLAIHGIDPGPEYTAWLTRHVPTATVEVWPDAGHYPHLVDPARFLARVREFAASL
jgi:pimeloyl-ACP methyl ester carboxylesterase